MASLSAITVDLYRRVMCRRIFYPVNKALYFMSLSGMGIGNWQTYRISGEHHFLKTLCRSISDPVVLDVGGNVGEYSTLVRRFAPGANITAFEPHPATYKELEKAAATGGFKAVNAAVSSTSGRAQLFDHPVGPEERGTVHASLVEGVIEQIHHNDSVSFDVEVVTIDEHLEREKITHVDLLKIDVEGNELKVLEGARKSIEAGLIDVIHFEFTETSMVSRTYMKDFYDLLTGYSFFRMLTDGLAPMGVYFPPVYEIFSFQNIVAIRKGLEGRF